ncbi:hypothetical protein ACLB2K_035148 [Fragaria x ananassa]
MEETGRQGGGRRRRREREGGGRRPGGRREEGKTAEMREEARVSQLNPKTLADEIICSSAKDKNFVGYTPIRRLNLLNSSAKTLKFVG